jgi:GTP-binding protein
MKIITSKFIKSAVIDDELLLKNDKPQIALIGRSNVGKSSLINSLLGSKTIVRVSSTPGRTRLLNIFLVNDAFYLVDLPGYGYAKMSKTELAGLEKLINWYLFVSDIAQHKVILIIDANIGLTKDDWEMFEALVEYDKDIVVVANKIDKLKKSTATKQLKDLVEAVAPYPLVPYSAIKKLGGKELWVQLSL